MRSAQNSPREPGATLEEALDQVRATRVDSFETSLRKIQYAGGHSIKIGMDTHELAPEAWTTLCEYVDLPDDLLPQLREHLGGIVFKCVKAEGRRGKNAPEVIRVTCTSQGSVLGLAPHHLVRLSNIEVVELIEQTIPANIMSEMVCAQLSLTPTAFELDFYTRQSSVEPRPGDVLYGGVSIRHSQAGCSPTVVLGYIHRLVCTNGMTQRVCLNAKPARTKRAASENARELALIAMRDQIMGAFAQLEHRLAGIKQLTEHPLDINELPETLRRRWSINRRIAAEIAVALRNDEFGRTYTEYDLVNALSRVATHNRELAPRYRHHLALAAGMFAQRRIHQCPRCGTWLRVGTED